MYCRNGSFIGKMTLLFLFFSILLVPLIEAQPKAEDKFGQLIHKLQSKQVRVRAEAVKELGGIKDKRAVPPLINALKDTDSYVRGQAARALGKIEDARAVQPLIDALGDNFTYVRREAATALGDIRDARAVIPLINFLKKDDTYAREEVAKSLIKIGLPAIAPLINAPKENNLKLVADAYYLFICMGESGSEGVLIEALYKHGSKKMALDLTNCGNIRLEEASHKWAENHNMKIKGPFGGGSGPVWGRCKN
jgi:HEAT repeat protein